MKLLIPIVSILFLLGCSSTKKMEYTPTPEESKNLQAGFIKGTIKAEPMGGACPYVIEANGESGAYYLDPINLTEYYKKDGQKIWFKFRGLRMMNRCEKANPVSIEEIKERSE